MSLRARSFIRGLIVLLLAIGPAAAREAVWTGRVVGVVDGDTIKVAAEGHDQISVRLIEIDAPEKGQPWGERSKQALSLLVYGQIVRVQPAGRDRYGRTLARVFAGGRDVNAELVRQGAAWAYRAYLTDPSLLPLESEARRNRRGLWSMAGPEPTPPWDWRREGVAARARSLSTSASRDTVPTATCGTKRYCREMSSCAEARLYLQQCGVASLDGDHDGAPCESLCQ